MKLTNDRQVDPMITSRWILKIHSTSINLEIKETICFKNIPLKYHKVYLLLHHPIVYYQLLILMVFYRSGNMLEVQKSWYQTNTKPFRRVCHVHQNFKEKVTTFIIIKIYFWYFSKRDFNATSPWMSLYMKRILLNISGLKSYFNHSIRWFQ